MDLDEVKNRTIRSIFALTGRTVFLQVINLGSFFLLGIFLSPSAIGVFIVVSALMQIFALFTDLGFGAALIQKHDDLTEIELRTVFTIQEVLVLLAVTLGLLATPWIKNYAHLTADGIFLYWVLLAVLLISSLKAIPSILLERKLAFETQVIPQIVESLVFNGVVVILAYLKFEVAAYSWAMLSAAIIGLPIYFYLSPWKMGYGFSLEKARKLISYGLQYQGKNVLAVIKDNLLTFYLSGLVGTAGIGYWGWAQRWAYSPFRLIVDSVTKVTFPAYSRVQHDSQVLKVGLEQSLFGVSLVLFPLLGLMAGSMARIVELLPQYAKWIPALPSFYLLCLGAAFSALSNILVNALDATGRVKTTLKLMIFWIAATWALTVLLVPKLGFTGIALASTLVASTVIIVVILVNRVIKFDFIRSIWAPSVSTVVMLTLVILEGSVLPRNVLAVGLLACSGVIIYAVAIWVTAGDRLKSNVGIILNAFGKTV